MKNTCQCARGVRACIWGSFSHVSLECHRRTMGSKSGPHFCCFNGAGMARWPQLVRLRYPHWAVAAPATRLSLPLSMGGWVGAIIIHTASVLASARICHEQSR